MQQPESKSSSHPVINALEGNTCSYCDEGTLIYRTFKGNDAIVCNSCETPSAQLW